MSPEQCRGDKVDARSDIFSLGSTLYSLLTGHCPFTGDMNEVFFQIASEKRPLPVSKINPSVPTAVSDIVAKAMAAKPGERFDNAKQFATALGSVAKEALQPQLAETAPLPKKTYQRDVITDMEILDEITLADQAPYRAANPKVWVAAGIGIAVVLLLAIVLNFGAFAGPSTDGMVLISAGDVQLGNSESHLRSHLTPHFKKAEHLEKLIRFVAEEPYRRERVDDFWIDRFEVTNAEYAKFVRETGRAPPEQFSGQEPPSGKKDHPVVNVTYKDAFAYAEWAGKKLPTRAQWLRAFRADTENIFPWGNQYSDVGINVSTNLNFKNTSAVDVTPKDCSPFGVFNMAGNVSEYLRGHVIDSGTLYHLSKGASWSSSGSAYGVGSMSIKIEKDTDWSSSETGFRCVIEK